MQKSLLTIRKYRARKVKRSISTRAYNHVVYKARVPVLRRHSRLIKQVIEAAQSRFGFKLKSFAIMEDHIHFLAQVTSRDQFANSMRYLAGQIALRIKRGKLWKQRLWSRAVKHGRDFKIAFDYVTNNPIKAGIDSIQDTFVLLNGRLVDPVQMYAVVLTRVDEAHAPTQKQFELALQA